MENTMQEGVITGFGGVVGSGLAFVHINGMPVPVESGYGLRVLEEAFGSLGNSVGKRISFSTRNGVLDGFTVI